MPGYKSRFYENAFELIALHCISLCKLQKGVPRSYAYNNNIVHKITSIQHPILMPMILSICKLIVRISHRSYLFIPIKMREKTKPGKLWIGSELWLVVGDNWYGLLKPAKWIYQLYLRWKRDFGNENPKKKTLKRHRKVNSRICLLLFWARALGKR